jgi:hypothetical protein
MKTILLFGLLWASLSFAKIEELQTYADFDFNQIDERTLVIFDIDNTLIRQNQMIGTHQWGDYMRNRAIEQGLTPDDAKALQHRVFGEVQPYVSVVPVEKSVVSLLRNLQKKGIPHFALTARPFHIADVTLRQIQILNHSFAKNFPEQIDPHALGKHLREGVIFSGEVPKGELLKRIVANSIAKPTKIIFFDDRRYNLESIETSFAGDPMELVNLRYGAADSVVETFDSKLADLEYSFLHEDQILISDEQAIDMISSMDRVVAFRFEIHLADQGPLVSDIQDCTETSEQNSLSPNFVCAYSYDGTPVQIDFHMKRTPEGKIHFGTW